MVYLACARVGECFNQSIGGLTPPSITDARHYGAPFVTCTLLSTEAILSRQKSKMWHLASGYAMCNTKVILSDRITYV